jgi:hypothetical protein
VSSEELERLEEKLAEVEEARRQKLLAHGGTSRGDSSL